MARRLATLLLAASVVFTGLTACPRGAWSCAMVQQANHACCGNHLALREHNCCGGAQQPSPAALNTIAGHPERDESVRSVAVSLWLPDLHSAVHGSGGCPICTGAEPVPADTPITQHTQLLL